MLGFSPLSSTPISALAGNGAPQASVSVVFTSTATLDVNNNLAANLDSTFVTDATLDVTKNLQCSISAVLTAADATLDVTKNLETAVDVPSTINGTVGFINELQAAVDVPFNASGTAVLDNNLAVSANSTFNVTGVAGFFIDLQASVTAQFNASGDLSLTKDLSASIIATNTLAGAANATHQLSETLTLTASITGQLDVAKHLDSSIDAPFTVNAAVYIAKNLEASESVVATVNADLAVYQNLAGDLSVNVTTAAELDVAVLLDASEAISIDVVASLDQTIALAGELSVTFDITVGTPVYADVLIESHVFALLDVDGNTEGSPGGIPVVGFYPPTSVILANHSESANAATYTITADIEPGYTTEILQVYTDINPNNVIELSYAGNVVSVYLNTPLEVYGMSSTFTVSRTVEPQLNVSFNYNLQLNTTITNNSRGNNFRSNKFYIYGNESPCFLRDDGAGFVTLFEESEPGLIKKLRDVGFINYTTGELSVSSLRITNLVESMLEFSATSLNNIVPTKDYFDSKNALLVQSKTVAFPTGEAVEIYQYSKAEELIDVFITVVARAYNPLAPEITIDQREAVYKLTVLPDYNIGKTKLQQLLQAA